ncbi:MAG: RsmE family RNA methyltransferase, partial [Deltaproteobacteria bacterium]|nr:RsmE family RNA methyltransferase [Deltaproteobacteria bacterium]
MAGIGRIRLKQETELDQALTLSLEGEGFKNLLLWGPRPGEAFTVSAPNGRLFRARLTGLNERSAGVLVFEDMAASEPSCEITLLQALPEKERMELIIQKAMELGAASVIPLKSARSTSLEERDSGQRKSHRWQDTTLRAARQSRSPFIT